MKLKKIDIDGFGVWNGLAIDDLADTTTIVYGPNEAGKTTLMQFVRAVLCGFTPERRKKYLPPVNGGQPGGRLLLADAVGQFHVHRSAAASDLPDDAGPAASSGGSSSPLADGGPDRLVGRPLAEVERYYTERALALAGGKRDEAARMLGIGERTLYRNLQKWKTEDEERIAGR